MLKLFWVSALKLSIEVYVTVSSELFFPGWVSERKNEWVKDDFILSIIHSFLIPTYPPVLPGWLSLMYDFAWFEDLVSQISKALGLLLAANLPPLL